MNMKLKRLTSLCFAVTMIFGLIKIASFTTNAVENNSISVSAINGDFEYEVLDEEWFGENTAMITDYNANATELVIPSEIDGYDVIGIGSNAFDYCTILVSVTIPDSVTFIGPFAFSNCSSLKGINIPESVTEIDEYAFECCTSLTNVTIPDSVTDIGEFAFWDCESLTNVTMSNSVDEIGWGAFLECPKLTSVTIPGDVMYIGEYAFGYIFDKYGLDYEPMDEFTIYGHTNSLAGLYAYENGLNFVSIGEVSPFRYDVIDDETAIITAYNGIEADMSIPSEIDGYAIVGINEFAFADCTRLTSVTIPDSVSVIGSYAFSGCTNLTDITIPDSVKEIGAFVFENTQWYNNQPDGVVYAGKFVYTYKGNMPENTSITLKDGTIGIAGCAFEYRQSLTSITMPDSVSVINSYAFSECTNLTTITIPDNVKEIGASAFENTQWYNNQPDGVVYAGKVAYAYKCDMPENTSITLKDGTIGIVDYAFEHCEFLASITIPDSVEYIGEYAVGFIFDEDEWEYKAIDGFKVYGYTGSEAETYAKENGFAFEDIGEDPAPILSDVNGDGKVNIDDVTDIQKYIANMLDFTENQEMLADVDEDGKISIDDVTIIQKYLAGMATI